MNKAIDIADPFKFKCTCTVCAERHTSTSIAQYISKRILDTVHRYGNGGAYLPPIDKSDLISHITHSYV